MKSLKESLFDKDLIERNISFFNYYEWKFGNITLTTNDISIVGTTAAVKELDEVINEYLFKKIFKSSKLKKLPKYKKLSTHKADEYEQLILSQIYYDLSNTPVYELDDRWKLGGVIHDSLKNIFKTPVSGGMTKCQVYPTRNAVKIINNEDINIRSIIIIVYYTLNINNNTYEMQTYLSFKKI